MRRVALRRDVDAPDQAEADVASRRESIKVEEDVTSQTGDRARGAAGPA